MERYNPIKIEEKWQKIWEKEQTFKDNSLYIKLKGEGSYTRIIEQ